MELGQMENFHKLKMFKFVVRPIVIAETDQGQILGEVGLPEEHLYGVDAMKKLLDGFEDLIASDEFKEMIRTQIRSVHK